MTSFVLRNDFGDDGLKALDMGLVIFGMVFSADFAEEAANTAFPKTDIL
eukprot:CAMPEP_0114575888 /NCGR_PEP_ID=MMETSP0125-20121206/709_1 /TAXON_ID=485358 ORGANISM="Aristerostoma sp., Strain ATCC 50986" /NCGR_SAMPLE_ID=MMETSP0125 /ASSEMBLY_ACC=CAM_ASM_000245 /LENGTH=48 /DNA_ID= /DNA_START= /DNA_END= /DNA_ORIENTATION=